MSMDFVVPVLQAECEEEEYDEDDIARQQEIHQLLANLSDDALDDSRDLSSPEGNFLVCDENEENERHHQQWQSGEEWDSQHESINGTKDYGSDTHDPYQSDYPYATENGHFNQHANVLHNDHHANGWNELHREEINGYHYSHENCGYPDPKNESSIGSKEFIMDVQYEQGSFCQTSSLQPPDPHHQQQQQQHAEDTHDELNQYNEEHTGEDFQHFSQPENYTGNQMDNYRVKYNPYHLQVQNKPYNCDTHEDVRYKEMQQEFLNTGEDSAEKQKIAQLHILYNAQRRQLEELQEKLEESMRDSRHLRHQLAITKDEKGGLSLSLQESKKLIQVGKEREMQLEGQIKGLQMQVSTLTAKLEESLKKQKVSEAAVDSMQQQMKDLCQSESLTRAREQHETILEALKEKHEAEVLKLQQDIDAKSHALNEQTEHWQQLKEQLKRAEKQQEEIISEKVEMINRLTKSLNECQQQCTNLLHTGTVQEVNQLTFQLQQAQAAKKITDKMNKSLQEELNELKEEIALYESAAASGIISSSGEREPEIHMSDSYVELGIKQVNWKSIKMHSTSVTHEQERSMSKDETIIKLKSEIEHFLRTLKSKRQKIVQLQDELKQYKSQVSSLQSQLEKKDKTVKDHEVRENSLEKKLETSLMKRVENGDFEKIQRENRALKQSCEKLEMQIKDLKITEENLKLNNQELRAEMKKMIHDFDQDKQETIERYERTSQQFLEDTKNHLRAELSKGHELEKQDLTRLFEEKISQLKKELSKMNDTVIETRECYLTVCQEKNTLENDLQEKVEQGMKLKEKELRKQFTEEKNRVLASLTSELEDKHKILMTTAKVQWLKEKEDDVKKQVEINISLAKEAWQQEHEQLKEAAIKKAVQKAEKKCIQQVSEEEAKNCSTKQDGYSQTDQADVISAEVLETRLGSQKLALQQEAEEDKARAIREAMKKLQDELEKEHQNNIAKQVEIALSNAYVRWAGELSTLPEYKINLETEKRKWEQENEKNFVEQISTILKEAEEKWEQKYKEMEKMEANNKNSEMQEKISWLERQLDHLKTEEAAHLKAELAKAHAQWTKEKQEEINRINELNEKDYKTFLDEHTKKLNNLIKTSRVEFEQQKLDLLTKKEADFNEFLKEKQRQWSKELAEKTERARELYEEELLVEIKSIADDVQAMIVGDLTKSPKSEKMYNNKGRQFFGELRSSLHLAFRDFVMNLIKQECRKSEEKLQAVVKEAELHKKEAEMHQRHLDDEKTSHHCFCKHCVHKLEKAQKECHDLRRNLEKACRHLQQSDRENKANMRLMKDNYEETIRKLREENLQMCKEKSTGIKKNSESQTDATLENNYKAFIQEGIEENRVQYIKALQKIKGEMLHYVSERKKRAAEVIETEILRVRQETARKMRKYYLTCLQQIIDEIKKKESNEKNINPTSKVTCATNQKSIKSNGLREKESSKSEWGVLSTKLEKDREQSTSLKVYSLPTHTDSEGKPLPGHITKEFGSLKSANNKGGKESPMQAERITAEKSATESKVVDSAPDLSWFVTHNTKAIRENEEFKDTDAEQSGTQRMRTGQSVLFTRVSRNEPALSHVTLRKQNMAGQAEKHFGTDLSTCPFDIQETPVRDGGPSDWSSGSFGGPLQSNFLPSYTTNKTERMLKHNVQMQPLVSSVYDTDSDDTFINKKIIEKSRIDIPASTQYELYKTKSMSHQSASSTRLLHLSGTRDPFLGFEGKSVKSVSSRGYSSDVKVQQDSGFDSPLHRLKK
ncbi:centrosomal protein of 152 kDa [Polypterus senegalus]|nr:centrosomal protein of 152 kDa [Polypterus senegalus]